MPTLNRLARIARIAAVAVAFASPFALSVATGALPAAYAGQVEADARAFVEARHKALTEALQASKDPRKDPKLNVIFDALLDYESLTRDAMGEHWAELDAAQQGRFRELLKQLIQKSYRKNLRDTARYAVTYAGETAAKNGVLVRTVVRDTKNAHEKPVSVDYVVDSSTGSTRVRDIVTEEVSLVGNYKKQFARILKKRGPDGLLTQMQKQVDAT